MLEDRWPMDPKSGLLKLTIPEVMNDWIVPYQRPLKKCRIPQILLPYSIEYIYIYIVVALFWNTSIGFVIRWGGPIILKHPQVSLSGCSQKRHPPMGQTWPFQAEAVHHLVGPVRLGCAWHLHRRWEGQPGATARCVDALLFFLGRSKAICHRCTAMKEETTARQRKSRSWFKRGLQP